MNRGSMCVPICRAITHSQCVIPPVDKFRQYWDNTGEANQFACGMYGLISIRFDLKINSAGA